MTELMNALGHALWMAFGMFWETLWALVLGFVISAALQVFVSKEQMTRAFGATQKTTCRITGRTMDECCCEMKDGKFYCTLSKKTYDQCCCDMK